VISGNSGAGLAFSSASTSGAEVQGNYIGVNISGNTDVGNGGNGIALAAASSITIGGDTTAARNIISANAGDGIALSGPASNNIIQNNYIGTDITGTADLGNGGDGISIDGSNNAVGRAPDPVTPTVFFGAGNLISGNGGDGVVITAGTGNTVYDNLIGTAADGSTSLPNDGRGVAISTSNNSVGDGTPGNGNIIAFNGDDGVAIPSGSGIPVVRNIIHSNGGMGIDLGANGVAANDAGDGDAGANTLQNYPVLTTTTFDSDTNELTLEGTLDTQNGTYLIEFYVNNTPDGSGYGEGEVYLTSITVTSSGVPVNFSHTVGTGAVSVGQFITATTTRDSGGLTNTSEFSLASLIVNAGGPPTVGTFVVNDAGDSGDNNLGDGICETATPGECTLRAAIEEINALADSSPYTIAFNIPGAGPHTIAPATFLPVINYPVVIDGTTEPDYADGTMAVVLSGNNIPNEVGLNITAGDSTVRGLAINRFSNGTAVMFTNNGNNTVQTCFIGTNYIGTSSAGTSNQTGIILSNVNVNTIGGSDSEDGNLISGNTNGIYISGSGANNNTVQNNYIGTDVTGANDVGNAATRFWTTWSLAITMTASSFRVVPMH
jgi:hypothetical protein